MEGSRECELRLSGGRRASATGGNRGFAKKGVLQECIFLLMNKRYMSCLNMIT